MATYFNEINDLMLSEMSDSRFAIMDTHIAKQLLSNLIITSATVEFYKCDKAQQYTSYEIHEKEIIATGNVNSLVVTLDTAPSIDEYETFVSINGTYLHSSFYTYDKVLNKITINTAIATNDVIDCGWEMSGYFTNTLSHREKYIIALGSFIHYLQQFINSERLLRQEIGDSDYKLSSNWQTLNSLLSLNTEKRRLLENLIYNYYNDNLTSEMLE